MITIKNYGTKRPFMFPAIVDAPSKYTAITTNQVRSNIALVRPRLEN